MFDQIFLLFISQLLSGTWFVCRLKKEQEQPLLCGWAKLDSYKIVKHVKFSMQTVKFLKNVTSHVHLAHTLLNICICFQIGGGWQVRSLVEVRPTIMEGIGDRVVGHPICSENLYMYIHIYTLLSDYVGRHVCAHILWMLWFFKLYSPNNVKFCLNYSSLVPKS
jgi:hypothetical protein